MAEVEHADRSRRRQERATFVHKPDVPGVGFIADRFSPRPFVVSGWLTPIGDRFVLTDLKFHSREGVDTAVLRELRLADLLSELRGHLMEHRGMAYVPLTQVAGAEHGLEARRNTALADLADGSAPKQGRKGYPDDHYRRIALRYLHLVNDKRVTRGVLNLLAAEEERPMETVRTWIHQARKRGFLSPGEQGRAGAMPGPRLQMSQHSHRAQPVSEDAEAEGSAE